MPINADLLTKSFMAMLDPPTGIPADEWSKAFSAYASLSVPGAANPGVIEAQSKAIILPAIATATAAPFPDASLFAQTLEVALISFWMAAIPLCLPATPVVVATPTLQALLKPAFALNMLASTKYETMNTLAVAIDTWTHTILYGPPAPAVPTIPLA